MLFFSEGDERFNIPNQIYSHDPRIAYILNGALSMNGFFGPPAGSAVSDKKSLAMKKALSEMADRRARMRGGIQTSGRVKTWDIVSGEEAELPYELTRYHSQFPIPIDTTGAAAHHSSNGAICSAVLELLEKNALFLIWYGQQGYQVPPSVYSGNYYERMFSESNLTVRVFVNTYFAPILSALVIAYSEDGRVFMGTGADTCLTEAILHAFQESYLLGWCSVIGRGRPITYSSWNPVGPDTLLHIKALEGLPYYHTSCADYDNLASHEDPLTVLKRSLPTWVKGLHIVFLPQLVVPGLRCVSGFSYELYSHRMLPKYIDANRRINQETLRLTDNFIDQVPICPLS